MVGYPSIAAMPINPGIDVMGQKLTAVLGRHVALPEDAHHGGTVGTDERKAPGQVVNDLGRPINDSERLIPIEGAETWPTDAFSNSMPGSFSLSSCGR